MKTWRFTFKCEYFGAEFELPFCVDADTYHDATIIADAYIKEKFPIACEQDLATIKFEGLGIDPKDWGKSKRELQEPCEYCNPALINPFIDDDERRTERMAQRQGGLTMYHIYRAREHVRLIYATGWRFIHNVGSNWYVGYTNELEDADLEKFDYEYLGYCDRNELERVIS